MPAAFSIKINSLRTANIGDLQGVVKHVEFTVKGEYQVDPPLSFELPQNILLSDPQSESFLPLSQITEENVIAWVRDNFDNMQAVESHIQYVLDKEMEKRSLTETNLPWVPVAETPENSPAPAA